MTPTGFLPQEDQGAFFVELAAARRRLGQPHRAAVPSRSRRSLRGIAGRRATSARSSATASSTALAQVEQRASSSCTLKPFEERTDAGAKSSTRSSRGLRSQVAAIREARSSPSTCRRSSASAPAAASSTSCRTCEGATRPELAAVDARRWCSPPTRTRRCAGLLHLRGQHAAALPRPRPRQGADARRADRDVFTALQATLGGSYVNDFNLFGRTWQVNIQAEAHDRDAGRRHLPRPCPQRATARWCRCARFAEVADRSSGRRPSSATTISAA